MVLKEAVAPEPSTGRGTMPQWEGARGPPAWSRECPAVVPAGAPAGHRTESCAWALAAADRRWVGVGGGRGRGVVEAALTPLRTSEN